MSELRRGRDWSRSEIGGIGNPESKRSFGCFEACKEMRLSSAEYQAILARQGKAEPSRKGCDREADLHSQIYDECRRRGWIALHGSMAARTHRTAGEPDFVILTDLEGCLSHRSDDCFYPSPPRVLFIECKTRTGKLRPEQAAMAAHAAKLGHRIHVVRSFEEFLNLL